MFDPSEEIPSYLSIDTMIYANCATSGFSCIYVYVNGRFEGVFEIPRQIPILASGEAKITLRPGIDMNGATLDRDYYRICGLYEETVTLTKGEITPITPTFSDFDNITIPWTENFESQDSYVSIIPANDTIPPLTLDTITVAGKTFGPIGSVYIAPDNKIETYDYTRGGDSLLLYHSTAQSYLEFSYISTAHFEVRIKIYKPAASTFEDRSVMIVYKSPDAWKRMYIDFSEITYGNNTATYYQPYFRLIRKYDSTMTDTTILHLDDIRIANPQQQ